MQDPLSREGGIVRSRVHKSLQDSGQIVVVPMNLRVHTVVIVQRVGQKQAAMLVAANESKSVQARWPGWVTLTTRVGRKEP